MQFRLSRWYEKSQIFKIKRRRWHHIQHIKDELAFQFIFDVLSCGDLSFSPISRAIKFI